MIKCPKCGKEIEDSYKFCPHCSNEIKEKENVKKEEQPKKKSNKTVIIIVVVVLVIAIVGGFLLFSKIKKENELKSTYNHGLTLIENKEWERATTVFNNLGSYSDSKEMLTRIIYLENIDKIENGFKYPSLYRDDLNSGISNLLRIKDYGDTKEKLDDYLNKIKAEIDKEKDVKNSTQKDYSNNVFGYLKVLDNYSYDKEYGEETSKYICEFAKQALKEGFYIYDITSRIKYKCTDSSFLENDKYYKLTSKAWIGTESKGKYASQQYFIQFLTTNVMTYDETYISIYGTVPLNTSYWYKIIDNGIYVKTNKSDQYKKKFTISKLTDTELKFSGTKYTLKKM